MRRTIMSNKLFYLTSLIVVLALAGFAQAELLVNPGFEADLEGWKTWGGGSGSGAGGWFYNGDTHATVMNDGTAHSGDKYVEVGIADMADSWWAVSLVFQEHPVTEGKTYKISGWLRDGDADGAPSLVEGGGQIQWEWRDATPGEGTDTDPRGDMIERVSLTVDLTEEWTYWSDVQVAPPGIKGLTVIFGTTWGGINLDVDDGSFVELLPVDPGADGLVAHYALDDNTADSTGNLADGTIVGDPVFVGGVDGAALDLNGDDYVDCGTNDVLNHLSGAMTVSAWVNIRSVTTTWMGIVMKGETAWRLGVNGDTTGIHWGFTGGTRGWQAANSVTELPLDEWHHIAGMYRAGEGGIVYVDGAAETVNADPDGAATNEVSLFLGENPEALGRNFDGILDEVRIYDRAVSNEEIRYLAGERAPYTYEGDAAVFGEADDNDSLDGTWDHDNGSDKWDSTGPGEGNPGGAVALVEDDVTFLRIQDTGDPRDLGIDDPSNRKVYLTHLTGLGLDGARLEVGIRVATTPPLDNQLSGDPWPEGGIGYHIRDGGKGMIGISDGVGIISFSLAKVGEPDFPDITTDVLAMNNLVGTEPSGDVETGDTPEMNLVAIDDATQWNTFVIDIAAGGAGTHVVTVSANGGDAESFDVTLGDGTELDIPYIALGSSGTGGTTAFDVDFITVGQTPPPEPVENLLLNPGFEEDELILDDPDWVQWVTWNPAEGAGSNATVVDTEAADGARSLLIEPIGVENWHFIVLYMPIPTEVGASYTTTFWAKAAEPRPLGVQYKATDNSVQWGFAEFNLTTEWAEYSLTAEAMNAETKLEFFCAGVEVSLSLDSVSVYKVADAPPVPEVVNLALNPSFEEDEDILNDSTWTAWCTWNPAEGEGSNVTIVDTESVDGARSLRVEPVGTENGHFIVANISFPLESGADYTFSFWAKAEAARPLTASFKAADNSVSWGFTDFELTTEWAEYSLTAASESDAGKLEFLCSASQVPFWLDSVSAIKAE